jgi:hypothetical protein
LGELLLDLHGEQEAENGNGQGQRARAHTAAGG